MGILGKVLIERNPGVSISTKVNSSERSEGAGFFLRGMFGDNDGLRGDHGTLCQPLKGPVGQSLAVRGVEEDEPKSFPPGFSSSKADEHIKGDDFGLLAEPTEGDILA